jgi:hypothetical protein
MAVNALLTQYNKKLLYVLGDLEQVNGDLIKSSINRIKDLSKKIEKSIRREAYINGGSALAAGVLGCGTPFMPDTAKAKNVFQMIIPAIPKAGDFFATLERGNETKHRLHQSLLQEHLLQTQRETKNKFEEARHTMEEKTSRCMDHEAQAFHR